MRDSWCVQEGNHGCSLNWWMGSAISRGIELRDEDIVSICISEPGSVTAGMSYEDLVKVGAFPRNVTE